MKTEEYLKRHEVGRNSYAIHYDTLKAAIIGSMDGQITTDGSLYYKLGLTGKEFHSKYANTPDWEELALFGPTIKIGTIIK